MVTLQELSSFLDKLYSPAAFKDSAFNGLQVEGNATIKSVATSVSASLKTIEEAIRHGVSALIVHHGIFWQNDSPQITGIKKKKLELLFKHGISLFAYHLPMDAETTIGNNWNAARELGWEQLEPFGLYNGTYIGVKGVIPECTPEIFCAELEAYYQHPAYVAGESKKKIKKVGLISGGAHRSLQDAIKENLDAFVTGSFDEPIWNLAAEEDIHFFALGHAATEKIGPKALLKPLQEKLFLNTHFIDDANPF